SSALRALFPCFSLVSASSLLTRCVASVPVSTSLLTSLFKAAARLQSLVVEFLVECLGSVLGATTTCRFVATTPRVSNPGKMYATVRLMGLESSRVMQRYFRTLDRVRINGGEGIRTPGRSFGPTTV